MIYFVQRIDRTGPIKIGWTDDLKTRLYGIEHAVGFRLTVLGVLTGWKAEEKALHKEFAPCRTEDGPSYEWFDPTPELIAYIEANARPWNANEGRALGKVSLDRLVISKAKYIASAEGTSVPELLSSLLEPIIEERFRKCFLEMGEAFRDSYPDQSDVA